MCRLSAFFGAPICAADLVTRPSRSIITQSFDARERMTGDASTPGYLNGDGFGLGWYSPNSQDITPCVYRQARPAWNDLNLAPIAEKVYTSVLFAHVRAASPGLDVSETTCHPFRFGRYLWMHNGGVGDFLKVRRQILPMLPERAFDFAVTHGSSDTALCFAIFLSLIEDEMAKTTPEHLRRCVERTIAIIEDALRQVNAEETSLLNFVVSDGESLVASRYVLSLAAPDANAASLYYASGNSYQSDGSAPGHFAMMHTDRRPSLAIVSSEPLTENRADWVSVPRNFTIVITKSMHILLSPIHTDSTTNISRILANLSVAKSLEVLAPFAQTKSMDISTSSIETAFSEETKSFGVFSNAQVSRSVKRRNEAGPYTPHSPLSPYLTVGSTVRTTISLPDRSVLCFAVMGPLLFSGTDDGTIHIWDMEDNRRCEPLTTGSGAVLALLGDEPSRSLFAATSASKVTVFKKIKHAEFSEALVVCCEGKGDTLSLAKVGKRLFAGFSDTNIRCVIQDTSSGVTLPSKSEFAEVRACCDTSSRRNVVRSLSVDEFPPQRDSTSAHNGYIFAIAPCLRDKYICTGCGDGIVRVWRVEDEVCVQKRDDHGGAILALATCEVRGATMLFSGSRDCSVKVWVWDGESGFICKRTLRKHKDEVVLLFVSECNLISGSADGTVCVWCIETLALRCQYKDQSLKAGFADAGYGLLFTASDEGAIHVRDIVSTEGPLGKLDESHDLGRGRHRASTPKLPEIEALPCTRGQRNSNIESGRMPCNGASHQVEEYERLKRKESNDQTMDTVVSEIEDESDDVDTLVPGVTNHLVLLPPLSPSKANPDFMKRRLSHILEEGREATTMSEEWGERPEDEETAGSPRSGELGRGFTFSERAVERKLMQDVLARFISFPTVPGVEENRESCWQGARYLGSFLEGLGASVKYVSTNPLDNPGHYTDIVLSDLSRKDSRLANKSGANPVILARFASTSPSAKTIVFYGHYDVMPADKTEWKTNPWSLTSLDGYLYGRGSTDNKGPLIAIIFAIKKLLEDSADDIGINIVLVVQGQGELANAGFKECIQSHSHWFDDAALILTSNSTWLGEEKPCITYGFRGIIELLVSVTGGARNLHTGVDGGATLEPMNDLIAILGTMLDASGKVLIPTFYNDIRPISDADRKLLEEVEFSVKEYQRGTGIEHFTSHTAAEILESRWRKPSISVASVDSSNVSGFFSVVPRQASAKISVRFVPEQSPAKLRQAIVQHLESELKKRDSPNELTVDCVNSGDWWLEDPLNHHFQIAANAVKEVWGVKPQYVCEGGSMPLFSFLSKSLNAPLVQVPLGQSSDGAHLPNERIRAMNLYRGKEVIQKIIESFSKAS